MFLVCFKLRDQRLLGKHQIAVDNHTSHTISQLIIRLKYHYFYSTFCSVGEPVELSSKFIRYSTFKTGKEQLVRICTHTHTHPHTLTHTHAHTHIHTHAHIHTCIYFMHLLLCHMIILAPPTSLYVQVNCGTLESLLERLVKVSHYGLDFLNTFLMTFPLYSTAHHILDFLSKSYHGCLSTRERKRSGSIVPQDAVRDARGERLVHLLDA